jgi:hypothetical protein
MKLLVMQCYHLSAISLYSTKEGTWQRRGDVEVGINGYWCRRA